MAIRGAGTVRFQLELGEVLEIHRVLFVLGMRVSKLLVSSFEDEGYGMMVRYNHGFLYRRDEPFGSTIMLGAHRDMLYVLRGHVVCPGARGWMSESEDEARVASDVHIFDEESDAL